MKIYLTISLILCPLLNLMAQDQSIEKPQELYQAAYQAYVEHQYRPALGYLDKAVSKCKEFTDAYILRARIKEEMDDLPSAITDLSIVIFLEPDYADARFKRGQLYYLQERYQDALTDFHVLLNAPKGETSTVYFKGKNDALGFSASQVTTMQSEMEAEVYNFIGLSQLAISQYDSAEIYFSKAIAIEPSEADYHANQGLLHEAFQDTLQAIKAYQQALSLRIEHAVALSNLAKLTKTSQYQTLVSDAYDMAVEQQSSYETYFQRAVMRQAANHHRLAIQDFDQAILMGNTNAEVLLMRAYSKERVLDLEGAIQDYTNSLRYDPQLTKAYINRGNSYYKLKKYQLAIEDYDTALQLGPQQAKIYYNRGIAHHLNGNTQQACLDLEQALEMDFVLAAEPLKSYCLSSQ